MAGCYGQPPPHPLLECVFVCTDGRRGEEGAKEEEEEEEAEYKEENRGTSLGQQSHTLPLTLAFSVHLNPLAPPAIFVRLISPLCVKLAAESLSARTTYSRANRLVAHTEALRSASPLQHMPTSRP
ncbi:unnamed protein product [Pleuronectes platessa]|uniref:Uncharacterized protein n=1 Tax=Pleuronectes platessa TaxID=8262 RepID=A0A9N7U2H5_PLEPL|nr:unnamed protein product [Pleuronectes platessa]